MALVKNSLLNLFSVGLPALLAIPSLAILARYLGVELFGAVTLVWGIISYSTLFDLGFSRAIAHFSANPAIDKIDKINYLNVALILSFLLGLLLCILTIIFNIKIVGLFNTVNVSDKDISEGLILISILFISLLPSMVIQGYLEGSESFKKLVIIRTITGVIISALPALFVLHDPTFYSACFGIFISRIITLSIYLYACKNVIKFRVKKIRVTCGDIFTYGRGVALSNVINPIMNYFDRFFITSNFGVVSNGYYSAASEIISKLNLLPVTIARVFFPRVVNLLSDHSELKKTEILFVKLIFLVCVPLGFSLFLYSEQIVALWLGDDYSKSTSPILDVLIIGFIVNSFSQIPFNNLQAKGLTGLTGLIHLIEVIPYLILMYFLGVNYGVLGVAWAWLLRVIIDFFIMMYFYKVHKNVV